MSVNKASEYLGSDILQLKYFAQFFSISVIGVGVIIIRL